MNKEQHNANKINESNAANRNIALAIIHQQNVMSQIIIIIILLFVVAAILKKDHFI